MTELKPCPFCGNDVYLEKEKLWDEKFHRGYCGCYEFKIICHECGCRINMTRNNTIYYKEEEARQNAIEAWNRRADNDAIDYRDRLEKNSTLYFE